MDPVTHGITGALIGKGYFSERWGRVGIFAAVLGSVFPDVDVSAEVATRDPLAIVKYHRGITHSFVGLPFFAVALALVTRPALRLLQKIFPRLEGIEAPSWPALTLIYGVGIASHILLDGMTSFGTRMWTPISQKRVAWDLLFIIDFAFAAVLLAPQVVAWIYAEREKSRGRAWRMWVLFTLGALAVWAVSRGAGFPFRLWIVGASSAVLAAAFFLPAADGWGFRMTRAEWCQLGVCLSLAYLLGCAVAHQAALRRALNLAAEYHIPVERIAALPLPPSLLNWNDEILMADGVIETRVNLRDKQPPQVRLDLDSPPDEAIAQAMQLREVQLYWQFARFPTVRDFSWNGYRVVDIGDERFTSRLRQAPALFVYRVVFDASGKVVEKGWMRDSKFPVPGRAAGAQGGPPGHLP